MVMPYPSVRALYSREPPPAITERQDSALFSPGDGFTKEEIENALDPLKSAFNPSREYLECNIGALSPGPQAVTFVGRVVNFTTQYGRSKSHAAATGWHYLIVKDDTGAICVGNSRPLRSSLSSRFLSNLLMSAGQALLPQQTVHPQARITTHRLDAIHWHPSQQQSLYYFQRAKHNEYLSRPRR
jgi:hypothetical protein